MPKVIWGKEMNNCKTCNISCKRHFCSKKCWYTYAKKNNLGFFNKKLQSKNGIKGALKCKKLNVGCYYNNIKKIRQINALKAIRIQRKNKTGLFHPSHYIQKKVKRETQIKAGKIGGKNAAGKGLITQKKKKIGIFAPNYYKSKKFKLLIKKITMLNRKNEKGAFFNPELNKKIRNLHYKNKRNLKFKNCLFDSKREIEIAYNLFYQFNIIPKERINCHFLIGLKEIDFKIDKFNCFIEVHPWFYKDELKTYYKKRLNIINSSQYKKYNLILII